MLDQTKAQHRKWWALALLATAQFVVVLDASVVNVALPSIGRDLGLSQEGLAWLVNAYVLAFGGFLLLGGRMADLLGRRRVFMAGFALFAVATFAGGLADERRDADRRPRAAGPRRRDPLPRRAQPRHDDVRRRRRAQHGAGRVGRGGGRRRRRGQPAGRRDHADARVGVGAVDQHADRDRRRAARARPCCASPAPTADRSFDALGAITVTGGLVALVYGVIDGIEADSLTLAAALLVAFVVIESRTSQPAGPVRDLPQPQPDRRDRDRRPDGRRADRPVLLRHALPAAGPALRPADGRPRLPAAGADDRRLRRHRQPALDQARPEAGARRAASPSRPPACTGSATSPPTAASSATSCSRASSSPSAWAWRSCR